MPVGIEVKPYHKFVSFAHRPFQSIILIILELPIRQKIVNTVIN